MSNALETLIAALARDLESLRQTAEVIDGHTQPAAVEAQRRAGALGVNEVVAALETVKNKIDVTRGHLGAAHQEIRTALQIASALPT